VAESIGVQFFTEAKAQYESAGKWRWIVLVLLVYLQVALVTPFVADMREKQAVDSRLAESRATEEVLKPLLDQAYQLANFLTDNSTSVANNLKTDLEGRFNRLNEAIEAIAKLSPNEAEGDKGASFFSEQFPMSFQGLHVDKFALTPMDADLRRRIAAGDVTFGGMPSAELQAYIESEVIRPAFVKANDTWTKIIAQDDVAAISKRITKAKAAAPRVVELDRLGKSVEVLRNEAQRVTFAPPADQTWWRTTGGKETSIQSMASRFLAELNTAKMDLHALREQISDLVGKNQQAVTELKQTIAKLEERATDLQSQLGEIGTPLKVVSFRLTEIAPLLPLIIAATLAAIAAWTADGLRRMIVAAELVGDVADRTVIYQWLHASGGVSRVRVAGAELAVVMASVIWVLASAWNVRSLAPPFLTQPILTVIAVAVVVAARAYHWRYADAAATAGP
jgi:PAS domain-containing protein